MIEEWFKLAFQDDATLIRNFVNELRLCCGHFTEVARLKGIDL